LVREAAGRAWRARRGAARVVAPRGAARAARPGAARRGAARLILHTSLLRATWARLASVSEANPAHVRIFGTDGGICLGRAH
jgi:hypothetical protein